MELNEAQIKGMAPDASSFSAGEKIARGSWELAAQSERALWGEVSGSGSRPYQVRVDLNEFAYRCTCPSRKLPCKHVLGLLLRTIQNPGSIVQAEEPDWIVEWLSGRDERAEKKKAKEAAPRTPAKTKERDKRVAGRLEKMTAGMEQFQLWLSDLLRSGTAELDHKPGDFWDIPIKRLNDAQLPGLGTRLRKISEIPGTGNDWNERLLAELGRLALFTEAWYKYDQFPEEIQWELRQIVGWNLTAAELEQKGTNVSDTWFILGQSTEKESGPPEITTQKSILWGLKSNRFYLYLQFAVGKADFPEQIFPGLVMAGEMRVWPGAGWLRGKFLQKEILVPRENRLPDNAASSIPDLLAEYSKMLGKIPWLENWPVLLNKVIVRQDQTQGDNHWMVVNSSGISLPLAPNREYWNCCALTYQQTTTLAGEWNGRVLTPYAAWKDGILCLNLNAEQEGASKK